MKAGTDIAEGEHIATMYTHALWGTIARYTAPPPPPLAATVADSIQTGKRKDMPTPLPVGLVCSVILTFCRCKLRLQTKRSTNSILSLFLSLWVLRYRPYYALMYVSIYSKYCKGMRNIQKEKRGLREQKFEYVSFLLTV